MSESKSTKVCVVCREQLTIETSREYHGDPMHQICGPGGRNQMTVVVKTRCDTCGLLYANGGGASLKERTGQSTP